MTPHKFQPGETVMLAERRYGNTQGGTFTILRAMPTEQGVKQYRVRSDADGHERIVSEVELH